MGQRRLRRLHLVTAIIFSFISAAAFARNLRSQYLQPLRNDRSVPAKCAEFPLSSFAHVQQTLTVGVRHSDQEGFDIALDITRTQVQSLHRSLKRLRRRGGSTLDVDNDLSPQMRELYRNVLQEGRDRGFTYYSEGEVLELLGLMAIKGRYPAPEYFVTGGLEYGGQKQTVGELDIVVVRASDCQAILIGEVKLNPNHIRKARSQLRRFTEYVANFAGKTSQPKLAIVDNAETDAVEGQSSCQEDLFGDASGFN
jgi:hypothetical protein